jgi:hypothetical protein
MAATEANWAKINKSKKCVFLGMGVFWGKPRVLNGL